MRSFFRGKTYRIFVDILRGIVRKIKARLQQTPYSAQLILSLMFLFIQHILPVFMPLFITRENSLEFCLHIPFELRLIVYIFNNAFLMGYHRRHVEMRGFKISTLCVGRIEIVIVVYSSHLR